MPAQKSLETYWRHHVILRLCNSVYKQNITEELSKGCIFSIPKKGDHGIPMNYKDINLTVMVYNALPLNRIKSEIEKILLKNQNSFRRNWSTYFDDPLNHQRGTCKKSWGAKTVRRFLQGILFDKMVQELRAYNLSFVSFITIMIHKILKQWFVQLTVTQTTLTLLLEFSKKIN